MTMEEEIAEMLTMKGLTLAVAESCTGGLLSHQITNIPGSSSFYQGGAVAYSNVAKIEVIGVTQECIRNHGSVSERTALAMARGVMNTFSADIGIGMTGIAGPGGGTDDKPVGLVFIAISELENESVKKFQFSGSRTEIKDQAVKEALRMCKEFLEQLSG